LSKKWKTAATLVPAPIIQQSSPPRPFGIIYYGTSEQPMQEAIDLLADDGIHLDRMRLRAMPFSDAVYRFIAEHEKCFIVEQNRDAQMRMLLGNELAADATKLVPVLHFDGTPITARFIIREIGEKLAMFNVTPLRKVAP
jgi:2-oxoglutarate ferredoxin oxidoreductase subunit alpha